MVTPGRIEGWVYNEIVDCNWKKCWGPIVNLPNPPMLILLADDTLWIAPVALTGIWGNKADLPPPPTERFTGPFATFEEGFAVLALMGDRYIP